MRLKEYIEDGRKGQLAKRSGISREYLSRYIQGHSLPTPQQAEALAGNLDLRPYELYEEFELAFSGTPPERQNRPKKPQSLADGDTPIIFLSARHRPLQSPLAR